MRNSIRFLLLTFMRPARSGAIVFRLCSGFLCEQSESGYLQQMSVSLSVLPWHIGDCVV